MRVAVLTLTRDRLEYTKVCFQALRDYAGIPFDHIVFDNGSVDGTLQWLTMEYGQGRIKAFASDMQNLGIHRAMNRLLDMAEGQYDLLVKMDNDCRILTPGTLKAVAEHVLEDPETPRVVSPLILGLRNRPGIYSIRESFVTGSEPPFDLTPTRLGMTRALGGIFMPIPPSFLKAGFRYDETAPLWGGDDERISAMAHEQGGYTAYLLDYEAEHYRTTDGQHEDFPGYFQRREREMGPP